MIYRVRAVGDWQLGSETCDEDIVKAEIDEICSTPNTVWVHTGDIEDEDRPSTRLRRKSQNADRPEVNTRDAQKHLAWIDQKILPLLKPLANVPCMGVLAGHHWTQVTSARNSVQYICARLSQMGKYNIPYLGQMSAWAWVRFHGEGRAAGEKIHRLFHLQHGEGGSRAVGSALKKLKQTADGTHANVYIRGHDPKLESTKIRVREPSGPHEAAAIRYREVCLLNIGSATPGALITRGRPPYSDLMNPAAIGGGWINASIRPYKPFENPRDGRKFTCQMNVEI